MGDRAGEQVRMLADCLVVGLAWSGGMLPGMGCVLVLGTDSLLDARDTWWTGCCLDWWAVTGSLVRDKVLAGCWQSVLDVVGSQ